MKRILLVEDDTTSQAFLRAATERLPAQVDAAGSVADAIALATGQAYDLWLVDANLPDGSGAMLLDRLRGHGLSTPAIAHTASHARAEHDALRAAGFVATLAKPLPVDAWCEAINRVLADAPARPASPGMDMEPVSAPPSPGDTPLWDDAHALAALGGKADNVAAMRALFLAELPGARDAVSAAVAAGDDAALQAALHRLRASCGFVGATRLDAASLHLRDMPGSTGALDAFLRAAQDTASSA